MASSFIDIGEIGFWANDAFVEVMQLCLIDEIENTKSEPKYKWLNDYKIELALQSLPLVYGGMSMALEEFLFDKERIQKVDELANTIIKKIKNESNYLTGKNIHLKRKRAMEILRESKCIEFKTEKDFKEQVNNSRWKESAIHEVKDRYAHSFKLLKQLINGELKTTAASPINYWNF